MAQTQKDPPGDRRTGRRRVPSEDVLPRARGICAELIPVSDTPAVAHADATGVADWIDA